MSIVQSIILAIVEGLTEFLPISSTGHMIVVSSMVGIANQPFTKLFIVAIQFGAILSVVVLYWRRFFESITFYYNLFIAFIPAAFIGLLLHNYIDLLLERVEVVAIMLIIGGVFFLFVDSIFHDQNKNGMVKVSRLSALKIGFFQTLAMIPGVSRSAATIIGGLSQKLNRKTAAEFSFFLAVPTMFAASAYKMFEFYQSGHTFAAEKISLLLIGNVIAFITALIAIKFFIAFLTRYGFKIFGYYRIVMGSVILVLYFLDINVTVL